MERRLSAIFAADMVGYSRLMEADEIGTIERQKAHRRELINPAFEQYRGRIVKEMGDGFLVEFPSVVEAVGCALAIQRTMPEREGEVPEDRRITYRVGINLGDVVMEDDDLFGDGVNVATRLEQLSEPGGICISGTAYDQIESRSEFACSFLGEQQLKNISRPIRAYRMSVFSDHDDQEGEKTRSPTQAALALPDKPSIAVLPFTNMSDDPEQEYFADGMTEDIITDLSKASGLFVIARNSSFAFKGQSPEIQEVCAQLGVRYILEGSVRRAGGKIRINAQLIDGSDGGHLWAERYDRDLEDIFAVQDDVTREIVAALRVELTNSEAARRESKGKINPEAYDHLYLGRACMWKFDAASNLEGRRMIERAIEIDPGLARAYSLLSIALFTDHLNGWNNSDSASLARALELAQRACELDRDDAIGFVALSLCQTVLAKLDQAEISARRAIELDPNNAQGYGALGQAFDFSGRHEQAAEMFRRASRLDPQVDFFLNLLGRALFALGRYDEAETTFRRRLFRNPGSDTTRAYLAALCGIQGRIEEAREIWRELLEINPGYDPELSRKTLPYADSNWFERYYGGLRKAGLYE